MESKPKQSALDLYRGLQASGSDYLLLAAAIAVPLYTSGAAILQPLIGVIFVVLSWMGMLVSYLIRTIGVSRKVTDNLGWAILVLAVIVATNLDSLNSRLPGGGFPWQLAPAAFMCWFIVLVSYFLWADSTMLFLLVPGISLFGVQSYIETAGYFVLSLILFMVSVAVLLTRLHFRTMIASAKAAGFGDLNALYSGPWKAVAGPVLAIVSVLVVAGSSYLLAPQIGGAVRKLAGEPEIRFEPPRFNPQGNSGENVARRIGNGPNSASNLPVLQVTTSSNFEYLRGEPLVYYHGSGWTELPAVKSPLPPVDEYAESDLADVLSYDIPAPPDRPVGRTVSATVESLSRQHDYAYSPGRPVRIEYEGQVGLQGGNFVQLLDLLPKGSKYYVRAEMPEADVAKLRGVQSQDPDQVTINYRGISRDRVSPRVQELAKRVAAAASNDYDKVRALIQEIQRRAQYNLKAQRIEGNVDRVETFLFQTHEGYCDLFASSLAVMCRSAGMYARPIVGYLVRPHTSDSVTVRDRDYHMWTEVFFEGYGWIPFDATSGATFVPGGEVGALMDEEFNTGDLTWAAWAAGSVFGLALIALVIGSYLSYRKTHPVLSGEHRKLRPMYIRFLRAMRPVLKRPKAPSETTHEYAQAYAYATENGQAALKLSSTFDKALFGQALPDATQLQEIRELLQQFEAETKAHAGR